MFFDIMKNIKYRDKETIYITGNKMFAIEIASNTESTSNRIETSPRLMMKNKRPNSNTESTSNRIET